VPLTAGLHYSTHESGNVDSPASILIHGSGGTHLHWPPQVRRLAGHRIYALDLPGHGRSEGIGRQRVEDYAQVILDFMKAMKLKAATMIGHSMGSAVALTLALDHPKRVLGLALLGAGARLRVAPAMLEAASSPNTISTAIELVTQYSYSRQTDARLKELAAQRMAETRPTVLHGDLLACDAFDVTQRLGKLNLPTLILAGAHDKMTPPASAEYLHEHIPGSGMEVIHDAGHMMMLEQPGQVARALDRFLIIVEANWQPGV
jgi:pimeloyl-ACP methyl ester carboxylesterase